MVSQLLGNYMVEEGYMTREQFAKVLEAQTKIRVKLGLIAVSEGLLTLDQADAINRMQQVMDKRFGDIAVEKGYLTENQVGNLLKMQGNEYLTFAQTIVDEGIVTMDKLATILKNYQVENGFTNSEMEAIKSGEPEKIVPLFVPKGAEDYTEVVTLALKTLIRCIDSQAYPMEGTLSDSAELRRPVTQELVGIQYWKIGFSDVEESLCGIASVFARDEFIVVDEDVQDAVGEFVNCINGIYATSLSSNGISVELMPPELGKSATVQGENILMMPMGVCGKTVNFIVTNQNDWR